MKTERESTIPRTIRTLILGSLLVLGMLIALQAAPANYENKAHNILQAATQSGAPFDYLVIILMENHGIGAITPDAAPYMTQLATNYGLATQYTALTHPSMANYIALTSGDTYGTDDGQGVGTVNAANIIDRLDAAGKTWKVYQESYDGGCSDSGSNYSVNHNPFVKYVDVYNNRTRCAKIVNTGDNAGSAGSIFLTDLASASPPNYMWLTPNRCNDMHDCDVPTGNAYLAQLVPQILNSNTFQTKKAVLFITFDEGDNSYPSDYVWTIWAGPVAKTHYQSSAQYDHYSALKTIETAWGLQPFTTKDGGATDMSGFFTGNLGRPNLTASFAYSPTDPLTGQTIIFTPSVVGGTPPYTYTWDFGDGVTATGAMATHAYSATGSYTVNLTVTDSATMTSTATTTLSVAPTPPPTRFPTFGPVIIGWGGTRLDETVKYDTSNPPSLVFGGEQASNQEMQAAKLAGMGFNALRVSFQSACTNKREMGPYDSFWLNRSIAIARHYNMWVIVDYHGYDDLVGSNNVDCWLSFWSPVVNQFKNSYDKIVWEPLNEPTGFGDDVSYLSQQYQRWTNQARSLGDNHWIVVQNLCSFSCGFANMADGFPTVTDPAGKVFISLHTYMGYADHSNTWNNATANAVASMYYQAVLNGSARTGWPVLNTEGGADELCDFCAPDEVLTGSAGYTTTTFHFIQALTRLYDTNTPQRINWVWWTMGSWTNTPGAGLYGSLAANGWGSLLAYQRIGLVGDINGDCKVDRADTEIFAAAFGTASGQSGYDYRADLNNDGKVDIIDLALVAYNFGKSC